MHMLIMGSWKLLAIMAPIHRYCATSAAFCVIHYVMEASTLMPLRAMSAACIYCALKQVCFTYGMCTHDAAMQRAHM